MSDIPKRLHQIARLEMLWSHLRRDRALLRRDPGMLAAYVHNSLWLEEGARQGPDTLIKKARQTLASRTWLQLNNRPSVTRSLVVDAEQHGSGVWALAWQPGNATLASGGSDGRIVLWDGRTARAIDVLEANRGSVNALAWSPDGAVLASGHDGGVVCLWTGPGDRAPRVPAPFSGAVLSLCWSADSRTLIVGTSTGELGSLHARTLNETWSIAPALDPIRAIGVSPDRQTIASAHSPTVVELRDLRGGELSTRLSDTELEEYLSPPAGGRAPPHVAGVCLGDGVVCRWRNLGRRHWVWGAPLGRGKPRARARHARR